MVVGLLVVLSILACVALVDSITSFQSPAGNSSVSNISKQVTPGITAKVTTKAATNVTVKATTKAATNVTAKATATPSPTPTPTSAVYTTNQIDQHFIDIAFGPNNPKISKVTASSEKIAITGMYDDADKAVLSNFIQQFNAHATTLTLPAAPSERGRPCHESAYSPATAARTSAGPWTAAKWPSAPAMSPGWSTAWTTSTCARTPGRA